VSLIKISSKSNSVLNGRLEVFYKANPYILKGQSIPYIIEVLCPDFINLNLEEKIKALMYGLNGISSDADTSETYYNALCTSFIDSSAKIPDVLKYKYEEIKTTVSNAETIFTDVKIEQEQIFRVTWI